VATLQARLSALISAIGADIKTLMTSGGPVYASGTASALTNTTTATDVATISIPGGTLGANGAVRIRVAGRYKNNSGSAATLTLQLSYGGTTMWSAVTGSIASNATEHAFVLDVVLSGANSASSQILGGIVQMSAPNAPTTGLGAMATLATATTGATTAVRGAAAVSSASTQSFKVNAKHSVANANIAFTIDYCSAFIEGGKGPKGDTGDTGPSGGSAIAVNTQSGTSYTLQATDVGKEVQFTSSSAVAVTVDPSVATGGSIVLLRQVGAGQITVAGASGVTVTKGGATLKSAQQGSGMYVRMENSTLAYVGGEVAAT